MTLSEVTIAQQAVQKPSLAILSPEALRERLYVIVSIKEEREAVFYGPFPTQRSKRLARTDYLP